MENKNIAYEGFKALENYLVTSGSFYADNLLVVGKYVNELEDKLSRRNMQIKDLKKELQELRCYIGSTKKTDVKANIQNVANMYKLINL